MWLESRRVLFRSDRKSVVLGKSVKISVDLGGRRIIKNKNAVINNNPNTERPRLFRQGLFSTKNESSIVCFAIIFFFKQKTAYEFSECDWSSDVCSSDLTRLFFFFKQKTAYEISECDWSSDV